MSGNSLSLDISTLYLVATFVAAMLGALLMFFWRQEKIEALGWWGAAYLLGAASIALWIAGGENLGFGLLLAVNAVGFIACGLVWDAARVFHGRAPSVIGVVAGAIVWLAAVIFADPLSDHARLVLGASIVAIYAALTAAELWRERRKSMRSRWPAIFVPILHGAVLMLPIVLGDVMDGPGTNPHAAIWVAAFAAELVFYAIGTVFIIFMLVSERTLAIHKTAASVDPLTGLLNRRGFGEATARMIEREAKAGRSITVMIFDIDHFKSVNDTYGHPVGDDVLKVFANVAVGALRITDLIGRVGGEEFAALLPCAMDEALLAAERVREAFEQSGVAIDGAPLATTVSIGVAGGPANTELDVLMASADTALYRAKRGGRNRVEAVLEEPLVLDHSRRGSMSQASRPAHEDVHAFVSEAHA
ncbi:putative diguanylate cyclase YcdT [Afipia felis]|uniref:diguanylate cyclase n=1 Tax=Afipia felis TaxID=1035 RepID=A0A090MK43_AFIFE|nr:GGDEF domain-containing protein [Afipia felis]RTL76967.1 MAG: GGDEF domain-containing protein [Bradyrhizobiaceae bacterium]CEG07830.1 putative diguanylate cyclase YcdT [Afipia felis]